MVFPGDALGHPPVIYGPILFRFVSFCARLRVPRCHFVSFRFVSVANACFVSFPRGNEGQALVIQAGNRKLPDLIFQSVAHPHPTDSILGTQYTKIAQRASRPRYHAWPRRKSSVCYIKWCLHCAKFPLAHARYIKCGFYIASSFLLLMLATSSGSISIPN